jgi:uncharacterized protein with HEPN domain
VTRLGPDDVPRLLDDLARHASLSADLVARGRAAYEADVMLQLAAEDLLVRMGEIAARLERADPGFGEKHPELELRALKAVRNRVAHGYDAVDTQIIWNAVARDVPRVSAAISERRGDL